MVSVDSICGRVAAAIAEPRQRALGVYLESVRRIVAGDDLDGAAEEQLVEALRQLGEPERLERDLRLIDEFRQVAAASADYAGASEAVRAVEAAWKEWQTVGRPAIEKGMLAREAELRDAGRVAERRFEKVRIAGQQLAKLQAAHPEIFGTFEVADGVARPKPGPVATESGGAGEPVTPAADGAPEPGPTGSEGNVPAELTTAARNEASEPLPAGKAGRGRRASAQPAGDMA